MVFHRKPPLIDKCEAQGYIFEELIPLFLLRRFWGYCPAGVRAPTGPFFCLRACCSATTGRIAMLDLGLDGSERMSLQLKSPALTEGLDHFCKQKIQLALEINLVPIWQRFSLPRLCVQVEISNRLCGAVKSHHDLFE